MGARNRFEHDALLTGPRGGTATRAGKGFRLRHLPRNIPRPLRALCAVAGFLLAAHAGAADLAGLLAQAEASDPIYRAAQDNALAVAEGIPQARAALFKPQLRFTTGGSRVVQDIQSESAFGAGGEVSYYSTDYRLSIAQPVFHRDRYVQLKQADKRLQQAQYELDASHQNLMLRLSERYFGVLAAQDDLAFARAERESLAGQLEQARQRFDVGLIAITDVQEAQAGYDRAQALVIEAENLLDNAHEALREVIGEYPQALDPLGDALPLIRPDPDSIERWSETALDQNIDLAAAQVAAEIAAEDIRLEAAGHYPSVDIVGGHGADSQGGRFGQTDLTTSDVGIRLDIPLYEGGAVSSRTRAAVHRHQAALERLEQTRRAVERSARESFLGVTTRISSVQALAQAVLSSKTALDSTRAGFEVGTRTTVDVVTAERGLSQARRDHARARYDYVLDILRLKQAAGTLAVEDIAQANSWLVPMTTRPPTPPGPR